MFYLDPTTGKRYRLGQPFSYGDINYTRQGANAGTFHNLGFTAVPVQPRPSDRFYFVQGPQDDGSWISTPRDLEATREALINESRKEASQLLTPTDWYYARQAELGEPGRVPPEVAEYRADVRGIYEQRKAAMKACVDIPALEALVTAPRTIYDEDQEVLITNPSAMPAWPAGLEVKTESNHVDYRGFYAGLLVSDVFQTIRLQAATDLGVNMNYTDFIAALADAKMGLGIDAAFQACIDLLIPSLTLTESEYQELEALYATYGLDTRHTLPTL